MNPFPARLLVLILALLLPAFRGGAQSPDAQSSVFMTIDGGKLGKITGEVIIKGREGSHGLVAYSQEVFTPRDAATGQATGKRQHPPFTIVKRVNQGSPLLMRALVENQTLAKVEISIWGANSRTGAEEKILTYTLTDVSVSSFRSWMPNKSDPAAANDPPLEEVAFVFHKIDMTHHASGNQASDELLGTNAAP